jgi:hypothetical protein
VASDFRKRQDRSQSVVVFWGPLFLSAIASIVAVFDAFVAPQKSWLPWALLCLGLLAAALWWRIYSDLRAISDLGATPIPDYPLENCSVVSAD